MLFGSKGNDSNVLIELTGQVKHENIMLCIRGINTNEIWILAKPILDMIKETLRPGVYAMGCISSVCEKWRVHFHAV